MTIHHHALGAVSWNDLAVVRVDLVEKLGVKARLTQVEGNLRLLDRDARIPVARQRTLQFRNDLCRKNDILLGIFGQLDFVFNERKAPSIGRHHRQLSIAEAHQHAFERLARIVLRGGVGRLSEHFTQRHLRKDILEGILVLGEGRKIDHRHAVQLEFGGSGRNERTVGGAHVHFNGPFRRFGDGVDQKLHGQRGGSLLRHLARNVRTDGNVEVRRREDQFLFLRLDQDILDDQHRSLRADDVLDLLQALKKL